MAGMDLPVRAIREQVAERRRPDHPADPAQGRHPPHHRHHRDRRHGGRHHHHPGRLPLRLRRRRRRERQVPGRPASRRACARASSSGSPTTASTSTRRSSPPAGRCDEPRSRRARRCAVAGSLPRRCSRRAARPTRPTRSTSTTSRPATARSSMLLVGRRPPGGSAVDPDSVAVTVDGDPVDADGRDGRRRRHRAHDRARARREQQHGRAASSTPPRPPSTPSSTPRPPDVAIGLVTFAGNVDEIIAPTTDHDVRRAPRSTDVKLTRRAPASTTRSPRASKLRRRRRARARCSSCPTAPTRAATPPSTWRQRRRDGRRRRRRRRRARPDAPSSRRRWPASPTATGGQVIPADPDALEHGLHRPGRRTGPAAAASPSTLPTDVAGEATVDVSVDRRRHDVHRLRLRLPRPTSAARRPTSSSPARPSSASR